MEFPKRNHWDGDRKRMYFPVTKEIHIHHPELIWRGLRPPAVRAPVRGHEHHRLGTHSEPPELRMIFSMADSKALCFGAKKPYP